MEEYERCECERCGNSLYRCFTCGNIFCPNCDGLNGGEQCPDCESIDIGEVDLSDGIVDDTSFSDDLYSSEE